MFLDAATHLYGVSVHPSYTSYVTLTQTAILDEQHPTAAFVGHLSAFIVKSLMYANKIPKSVMFGWSKKKKYMSVQSVRLSSGVFWR